VTHEPNEAGGENNRGWLFHIGMFFGGVLLAVIPAALLCDVVDCALRYVTGILELCGLAGVASGLRELRMQFELPSVKSEVATDIRKLSKKLISRARQFLGLRADASATVTGVGISIGGGGSVTARGTVRLGPNSTLEERVAFLERRIENLQDGIWRAEDAISRETEERKQTDASEQVARSADDARLARTVRSFAIGGIRLEIIGVLWLALGIAVSTWAPEITAALK
jgi:hypothetical protein